MVFLRTVSFPVVGGPGGGGPGGGLEGGGRGGGVGGTGWGGTWAGLAWREGAGRKVARGRAARARGGEAGGEIGPSQGMMGLIRRSAGLSAAWSGRGNLRGSWMFRARGKETTAAMPKVAMMNRAMANRLRLMPLWCG